MNYQEARRFLDRYPRFEVKPGLSRIQQLTDALGRPHLSFPTVHVGGTNGKGSVVAMLDAVLRCAGLQVGRFTSPELFDFRDRITVNGEWISERDLADGVQRMQSALDALDETPSQFEVITALAFDHLARAEVEMGVIEVGLGGRFDATNVIRPELAILTNVTLDHQAILGDTVEAIAWEKAGIAKPGTVMIVGDVPASVAEVVQVECLRVGAILRRATSVQIRRVSRDWRTAVYQVRGMGVVREVEIPLVGSVQLGNLRLVLEGVIELRTRGFRISDDALIEGLRSVRWPGRFEVMRRRPTIVVDGAHNPDAIRKLGADVAELVPDPARRFILYGALADKDVDGCLAALAGAFPVMGVCASESPRALAVDELYGRARKHCGHVIRYDSIVEGIEAWSEKAAADDVMVIAGSLTVAGEARRWLVEGR